MKTERLTWIDTHAHLDFPDYDEDRAALIGAMFSSAVGAVTVGTDVQASEKAVALAKKYSHVWASVGIHPHDAQQCDGDARIRLKELAGDENVVAVGEIGLDYYRDRSPRNAQRRAFEIQLELSHDLGLPVIVHNRDASDDTLAVLKRHGSGRGGVVHSFLQGWDLAQAFLNLGLHLGIGGPVTFRSNDDLRDTVRKIPLDRILLETDCPFLTPEPHRGHRNEPGYVQYVARTVAQAKDLTAETVADQTTRNARRLFALGREN